MHEQEKACMQFPFMLLSSADSIANLRFWVSMTSKKVLTTFNSIQLEDENELFIALHIYINEIPSRLPLLV